MFYVQMILFFHLFYTNWLGTAKLQDSRLQWQTAGPYSTVNCYHYFRPYRCFYVKCGYEMNGEWESNTMYRLTRTFTLRLCWKKIIYFLSLIYCKFRLHLNRLTPNDPYMGRTAPLTSKRCSLYIYSTNISTEYFKHVLYSPFFFSSKCSLFYNANLFGSCIIHILYTGCAKIKKKKFPRQKVKMLLSSTKR